MKLKNYFLSALLLAAVAVNAQDAPPENWFNLDLEKDSIVGVGTERAYELLKGRQSKTVIVAVIDDGIDFNHEDLKDIIWTNEDEIPGNGVDDDKNGYIDDVHGWNFIGGKNGNVDEDTYEVTRLFSYYSKKFENADPDTIKGADKKAYNYYKNEVKPAFLEKYYENASTYLRIGSMLSAVDAVSAKIEGDVTVDKLKELKTEDPLEEATRKNMITWMGYGLGVQEIKQQLGGAIDHYKNAVEKSFNTSFDPRNIVGDNYENANERGYGNNDYRGPNGDHGSHVAGIIAAIRSNSLGMKGIADNVKIMIIRVVPDGDERDKDVANGIRYAVDNGATVVNMSFGKAFTYNKQVVDDAVRHAAANDVLLVHAAGNEALNIDKTLHYPTDTYLEKGTAKNWLEIGACTHKLDSNLPAEFSNWGKKNVDVFAPGVEIYSSIPDNKYASFSGTSMASPVTAGVAALLRSYFPELTAEQVKDIIMKSATKITIDVVVPGTNKKEKMTYLCKTGGVVNAYKAVELAMKTKGKKK
ncbi:MAG TPA: S8 family peptidase [Bacteroidia bacterium]|nr:S8 family peptidase [Bacteroidia bacterium]